jgi:hypothetical protein
MFERVFIRDAKFENTFVLNSNDEPPEVIPQNILIKFVRNAPLSMRWFRSDLTPENMQMLRLKRPDIEFFN